MSDHVPRNRWLECSQRGAHTYDDRFNELAAAGRNVHGEADFVRRFPLRSVLDAGCGTGRVAIELSRRGYDVAGVDLDPDMLEIARDKDSSIPWVNADLEEVDLGRTFDAVVMAGNVMVFVTPGSEGFVLANVSRHLVAAGICIAGFSLLEGRLDLDTYDRFANEAGLQPVERWSTWDCHPFVDGSDYAVSVHRKLDQ